MKKQTLRNLAEVLRDEMYMQSRITETLKDGPKTIPDIADKLNSPQWEVTMWVMAMRRYGRLTELTKSRADDYYQYKLVEEKDAKS
jgi:hypothetical protein